MLLEEDVEGEFCELLRAGMFPLGAWKYDFPVCFVQQSFLRDAPKSDSAGCYDILTVKEMGIGYLGLLMAEKQRWRNSSVLKDHSF